MLDASNTVAEQYEYNIWISYETEHKKLYEV